LQLAQLWAQRPFLRVARFPPEDDDAGIQMGWGSVRHPDRISALTEQFEHDGFQFVPVVTSALKVSCALNILYLRSGPAGRIIPQTDIDNRLKTLFDALRMPAQRQDLGDHLAPDDDETPFYCLVEDDSLITSVAIETDLLLEQIAPESGPDDARLLIRVTIRPRLPSWTNLVFS
jgi:hypothetical protein